MPAFPMLAVKELTASGRWYQDALGFRLIFSMPGPDGHPTLMHLRWKKYADLLLVTASPPQAAIEPKGAGVTLYFAMDSGDVDQLAERARAHGATLVSGPVTQPWNAREVTLLDPDGYRLTFTQRADERLDFEQVVSQVARHAGGEARR